jgi:hypothetical protein
MSMDLVERLVGESDALVEQATSALEQARLTHYQDAGRDATRERVAALLAAVLDSLREGSPVPVVEHADRVARERYHAGYGIDEIQVAFNTLEEAIWRFLAGGPPDPDLADELGQIGTVLGHGKDQLARSYVELVAHRHAPAVDVEALHQADVSGSAG